MGTIFAVLIGIPMILVQPILHPIETAQLIYYTSLMAGDAILNK